MCAMCHPACDVRRCPCAVLQLRLRRINGRALGCARGELRVVRAGPLERRGVPHYITPSCAAFIDLSKGFVPIWIPCPVGGHPNSHQNRWALSNIQYSTIVSVCQAMGTHTRNKSRSDSWNDKPSGTQWLVGTTPQRNRCATLGRVGVVHALGGPCHPGG